MTVVRAESCGRCSRLHMPECGTGHTRAANRASGSSPDTSKAAVPAVVAVVPGRLTARRQHIATAAAPMPEAFVLPPDVFLQALCRVVATVRLLRTPLPDDALERPMEATAMCLRRQILTGLGCCNEPKRRHAARAYRTPRAGCGSQRARRRVGSHAGNHGIEERAFEWQHRIFERPRPAAARCPPGAPRSGRTESGLLSVELDHLAP